MTKTLILAAFLGLSVSAAHACDFMKSARNSSVDATVVASVTKNEAPPMSVPSKVILPEKAAVQTLPAEEKAE